MKPKWNNFLKKIQYKISELENNGVEPVSFRGQSEYSWDLVPSIFVKAREREMSKSKIDNIEKILYYDFVTNAGGLLKPQLSSWEILFEMRHHGIPTRLLDWTESFATALYFALNGNGKKPTIWLLDPYSLNSVTYGEETIPNPITDLEFNYYEAFIENSKKPYETSLAIIPPRTSSRLFAQKGLFTLQGSNDVPMNLDIKTKHSVFKFEIPEECIDDAKIFLKLAGVNHYSIYPDLDGLSRYLNEIHGFM